MASNLQLGQKLGMSLDDLIKKTQEAKKKAPVKPKADGKKPGTASKAGATSKAKGKPPAKTNAKRPNKPVEKQPKQAPKQGAGVKKNTTKKPTRAAAPNAPKRVPTNPRGGNRKAQPSQTRVGDLLNMNVSVSSKKDAQAAIKIAKQLEAEARKYLGPSAPHQRQQHQQQVNAMHQPHQRQAVRQKVPQRMQQRRVPYSAVQGAHWPEPQTENFLADHDRMSDRDSEHMEMDEEVDLKPNLAALQAQATHFARGVRGQSRR